MLFVQNAHTSLTCYRFDINLCILVGITSIKRSTYLRGGVFGMQEKQIMVEHYDSFGYQYLQNNC